MKRSVASYFTEFSPSGRELLNVTWPIRQQSYRTLFGETPSETLARARGTQAAE